MPTLGGARSSGSAKRCLGLRTASRCGRGDRAPPKKPPFAPSPAFPRKAIPPGLAPLGGAGSARPQGRLGLRPGIPPLGHRALVCPSMIMLCLGLRRARLCGRAERVPPRKSPPRHVSWLSPQGHPNSDHPPRRGGLRTPAKRDLASPRLVRIRPRDGRPFLCT